MPEFSVTSRLPSIMNGGKDFCAWSREDDDLYRKYRIPVSFLLKRDGVALPECAIAESKFEKGEEISGRMLDLLGSYYDSGAMIDGQTLTLPIKAVESDSETKIGTITVTAVFIINPVEQKPLDQKDDDGHELRLEVEAQRCVHTEPSRPKGIYPKRACKSHEYQSKLFEPDRIGREGLLSGFVHTAF